MLDNYNRIKKEFSWSRPTKYNFAADVIDNWAQETPENLALMWVDDNENEISQTFLQVSTASKQVANMLATSGVKQGDIVIIILGRQLAWWETVTACIRMGAIFSPGTTQLSAKDIAYRINATEARCVVTDVENASKVDEVLAQCPTLISKVVVDGSRDSWINYDEQKLLASPSFTTANTKANDDALCFFTSGTTGFPKMCIHNQLYALGHTTTGKFWLDLKAGDLHWNISDTGWGKAAWSSYYGPWLCGAAIFIHHTSGFNPERSLAMFDKYPITTFCGAPTIYRMFVQEDLSHIQFKTLRHCVGAGEPLNPEVIQVWKQATDLIIRDGYGQTESVILCGNMPCIEPRFGSMGKPMPGIDLAVINEHGQVVPANTEGDIAIQIKNEYPVGLFKEYKGLPEKTNACFRGDWYLTGDRAKVDDDGYFWFISRADDVILSSGYRIGPFEVESALIEHAAVAESAVVASPDKDRGEVVKAFVVLTSTYIPNDALVKELQNHVKSVTAPYKYPRLIEFVESLPKTVSGKIRRVALRQMEFNKE